MPGAVGPGKLAPTSASWRPIRRCLSPHRAAPRRAGAGGTAAALRLTARQLRINQRIAQEAVRRGNALADQLGSGLSARHFADDTVVATNLAGVLRP